MGKQTTGRKVGRSHRIHEPIEPIEQQENHLQVFARLVKAGDQGIHGKPGSKKA